MRKVVVTNIMSLDGCFTGPEDNVMVMPFDRGFDEYNAERLAAAGTMLVGRKTFQNLLGYWPSVVDNPDHPPAEQEVARLNRDVEKVVVSDTLAPEDTGPWQETTRIVRRPDAHAEVGELRQGEGRDILVVGSHVLWNDLLGQGLVDELHLMVGPGAVGDGGVRAFTGGPSPRLTLAGVQQFEGSSLVLLRYAV